MNTFPQFPAVTASRYVRTINDSDGSVLLDIQRGVCVALNPTASVMWDRLCAGQSAEEIADYVTNSFAVPYADAYGDVIGFCAELLDIGLLEGSCLSNGDTPTETTFPVLGSLSWTILCTLFKFPGHRMGVLFWKALAALAVFDFLKASSDFKTIYVLVSSLPVSSSSAFPTSIDRVRKALNYACIWYPKRVLCLQRSAVGACLLRSCGVAAKMVLGAKQLPFKAHAWIEVEGRPLDEGVDVNTYMVWDKC